MNLRAALRRLLSDDRGSAAEFALVLPLAMLFFVGLLDAGRYAYSFNQGEKATQIGARWAVVTDPIAPEFTTASYLGQAVSTGTLTQGDRIPAEALDPVVCTSTTCVCAGVCPAGIGAPDANAFNRLVDRMQEIWPQIEDGDVRVEYTGSGLGYAGNPDGMDIAPFVTVRLAGMQFTSFLLFGAAISMPDFSYTLTMEDGQGTGSN